MITKRSLPGFKLGIDLGGTKTEVVVLDGDNGERYRKRVATPSHDYNAILHMIVGLVTEAERELQLDLPVGIGTPGAISPRSGLLRNSNTLCMNGKSLRTDIEQLLQRSVKIQNDANCFAMSEALIGAGKGYSVVFGVIIGTGAGGGLVVNRQLLSGTHMIAGEWGHNPLPWSNESDALTECYCGKHCCIETYVSGGGLATNFYHDYGKLMSGEQIVQGARNGEPDCQGAMAYYYDQLARSLALVINIVDPDVIILGGGMSNVDEVYQQVPNRLPFYVFSDFVETPILPALHGDASGVFGAALLSN